MTFEDELRAAMHAHDGEAPASADLSLQPWRRRRTPWLPLTSAAAVVLIVAGALLLTGRGSASHHPAAATSPSAGRTSPPSTALHCPATHKETLDELWVPAQPRGMDATDRLVPEATPTTAVVCAYLHDDDGKLTASRPLESLDRLPSALTWLPRLLPHQGSPCASYLAVTDGDNYLIGLTYGSATMWVAAPGEHCDYASNGPFVAYANLRAAADTAFRTGAWPAVPTATRGCDEPSGRIGQDRTLVPPGPIQVTICAGSANRRHEIATSAHPTELVAALDRLPTAPNLDGLACLPLDKAEDPIASGYDLHFHYAVGPDVVVFVWPDCAVAIQTLSRKSTDASTVMPLVDALIAHH